MPLYSGISFKTYLKSFKGDISYNVSFEKCSLDVTLVEVNKKIPTFLSGFIYINAL